MAVNALERIAVLRNPSLYEAGLFFQLHHLQPALG